MRKAQQNKKKAGFRNIVMAVLSLAFFAAPVLAQSKPIPEDLLALDQQRCMNGCVPGFGEKTCKSLCDCTVNEFKKKLTFESYLDMSVQLSKNELTESVRSFLDTVANYCTAELDRKGIEVGEGTSEGDADGDEDPSPPGES